MSRSEVSKLHKAKAGKWLIRIGFFFEFTPNVCLVYLFIVMLRTLCASETEDLRSKTWVLSPLRLSCSAVYSY